MEDLNQLIGKNMKKKKNNKKKRERLGISMGLFIYHPRKNITAKEMNDFAIKITKIVEKNGWYAGGGYHIASVDKSELPYINVTPKHILDLYLDE